MGIHKNCLGEMILMITHIIFFYGESNKISLIMKYAVQLAYLDTEKVLHSDQNVGEVIVHECPIKIVFVSLL